MKRTLACLSLALGAAPLAGCYEDSYGSVGVGWNSYPYAGWYDGYYGPIYDGYWGTDNFFYYRLRGADRRYHRGDQNHFRHGDMTPGGGFQHFEGQSQQPPRGARMPNYPSGAGGGGHRGGDRHRP